MIKLYIIFEVILIEIDKPTALKDDLKVEVPDKSEGNAVPQVKTKADEVVENKAALKSPEKPLESKKEEEVEKDMKPVELKTPDSKIRKAESVTVEKEEKLVKKSASLFDNDDDEEEKKDMTKAQITDQDIDKNLKEANKKGPRKTLTANSKPDLLQKRLSQSSKGYTAESSEFDPSGTSLDTPFIPNSNLRMSMATEDLGLSGYFQTEVPYGSESSCFSVSDPIKGNPVTYLVRGVDNEGPFEISRRYNDFYNFYNTLLNRWPGIYIPPIPPKKVGGNKDDKYLRERRIFLEKFIRVLGENDFLIESEEFKIFSRHTGSIDKVFKVLPKLTSDVLLKRFQSCLDYNETPDINRTKNCVTEINEFSSFAKKAENLLREMRDRVKEMAKQREEMNKNYVSLAQYFNKYEEHNLNEYCEGVHTK